MPVNQWWYRPQRQQESLYLPPALEYFQIVFLVREERQIVQSPCVDAFVAEDLLYELLSYLSAFFGE